MINFFTKILISDEYSNEILSERFQPAVLSDFRRRFLPEEDFSS